MAGLDGQHSQVTSPISNTALLLDTGLTADADCLQLGRIPTHAKVRRILTLRNPTARSIDITQIVASCGCTQISPISFRIESGATQHLNLEISAHQHAGSGIAEFSGSLTLYAGQRQRQLTLNATAYDALRVHQSAITFAKPIPLGAMATSEPATVIVDQAVSDLKVSVPQDGGRIVNLRDENIEGSRILTFQVELASVESVGSVTVPVIVTAFLSDSEPAHIRWTAMSRVESDIRYSPSSLIITSEANVAGLSSSSLSIWSDAGSPISDLSIDVGSLPVNVTFQPESHNSRQQIEFKLTDQASPNSSFGTVVVRGTSPQSQFPFRFQLPVTTRLTSASGVVSSDSIHDQGKTE